MENIHSNILLFNNALSNERKESVLSFVPNSVAEQGLLAFNHMKLNKKSLPPEMFVIETILIDDIVDYLPKRNDGTEFRQAIMKVDIEGFEPFAFEHASLLFDRVDIRVVIMEWFVVITIKERDLLLKMMDFFYSRSYLPHSLNSTLLEKDKYEQWPRDIAWMK